MAVTKQTWNASAVFDRLCATTFSAPAHAVLSEVRNGTGYGNTTRTADALIVSLWPSRGIWFAGVEIKVSRSDWMAELRRPEKSAEIQQWCDHWWVATPPGIVQPGELPVTWGLIEVGVKSNRIVTPAPKLDAKPLSASFVAAILRNRADGEARARNLAVDAALLRMKQAAPELAAADATQEIANLKRHVESLQNEQERMLKKMRDFETASGVALINAYDGARVGKEFAVAQRLASRSIQLDALGVNLAGAVAEIQKIADEIGCKPARAEAAE